MISIIIPTYNRPELLHSLLESIRKQTYSSYEVIVVDDNSPKKEENESVCKKYDFVTYHCNKTNKWAPYCRNFWIKKAKYKYICLSDDDDTWFPKKLEKQLPLIQQDGIGLVYTHAHVVNEKWDILKKWISSEEWDIHKELLIENFIPSSSVMIKKECFETVWYFDESFPSCQDREMWYRISKKYNVKVAKDFLIRYLKHSKWSIGTSPKAAKWYIKFGTKYLIDFIKEGLFLNAIKYIAFWFKTILKRKWNGK